MTNPWGLPVPESDETPDHEPPKPDRVPWWYWVGMGLAVVAGVAVLGGSIFGDIGRTTARSKLVFAAIVTVVVAGIVHAVYSWVGRRRR